MSKLRILDECTFFASRFIMPTYYYKIIFKNIEKNNTLIGLQDITFHNKVQRHYVRLTQMISLWGWPVQQ